MSFKNLSKPELYLVAEHFGVDLGIPDAEHLEDITQAQMIAKISEDGVDWAMYKEAFQSELDQPDVVDPIPAPAVTPGPKKQPVLLKMVRENPGYETRGYSFTREHPFLPVDEDSANWILDNEEGFRVASPREVDEYYS